jgi:hypothetical protein
VFKSAKSLDIRALGGHEFVENIFDSGWVGNRFPAAVDILISHDRQFFGGDNGPKTAFILPTGPMYEAVIYSLRDSQHRHHQFPKTWTAPNQHRIVNQVVLPEMQRVLEHLCFECQTSETATSCRFDEPSLIAFPPSLSTTTPQKKARFVTKANFEVSQSSPEARGTAFLGEVLKTIEPRHETGCESNVRSC